MNTNWLELGGEKSVSLSSEAACMPRLIQFQIQMESKWAEYSERCYRKINSGHINIRIEIIVLV